jgi:hypothetical protein
MCTNNFRPILSIITALLLSGLVTSAQAQAPGFYVGVALGSYSINNRYLADNDRVTKRLVGYRFINYFSVEGAWTGYNRFNNGTDHFEADRKGLVAVLTLPSGIFIKGGHYWWGSDTTVSDTSQSNKGNDSLAGVGYKYDFTNNLALRFELESFQVLDTKINTYTTGLDFSF